MNIEEIHSNWEIDQKIDITHLIENAQDIGRLHSKYLKLHSEAKLKLRKLEAQQRMLRLQKFEHYTQGPSPETKNWAVPAIGKVLKSEAKDWYIEADEDINKKQLEIDYYHEKVDILENILDMIKQRQYLMNLIHNHMKWTGGG